MRGPEFRFETVIRGAIGLALFALGGPTLTPAQQSASFRLERLATVAAAGRMSSASYANAVSLSELAGSAAHCPSGSATHLGFWSVLGPGDAQAIVLRMGKHPASPGRIDLSWTGQAPGFRVHRSPSPTDVAAPQNLLASTGTCTATDTTAPALAFYLVRAAASAEAP